MNRRDEILALLNGEKISSTPAFSGLIHVTAEGLQQQGLNFHEIHHDARKMAQAAASTFQLTGMPSAALPLDLCAPAEAWGAQLKFYPEEEFRFPQVSDFLFESTRQISAHRPDFLHAGRLPIIYEAIRLTKEAIGKDAVISGVLPGPYTLLLYLCHPRLMFIEMKKDPQPVIDAVHHLAAFLTQLGIAYRTAGADFITIHEMGGSPGFIGPAKFEQFVFPALKQLIDGLPKARVLSICGNTNKSMDLIVRTGADAISVDQTNDLPASRAGMTATRLFGNIDPVATLWQGDGASITGAVHAAKEAGVDAIWPGCDLVVQTSIQNIKAFTDR